MAKERENIIRDLIHSCQDSIFGFLFSFLVEFLLLLIFTSTKIIEERWPQEMKSYLWWGSYAGDYFFNGTDFIL